LEGQKRWIILVTSRNIQISPLTKITKLMPAINELSVSIYLSMSTTTTNLLQVILVSLWTQTDISGIFKIIQIYERNDGANKMQIEQYWGIPQTVLYESIFRAKKLETKSTTKKQENLKNGKVRCRLDIEVRKETEDSWLTSMKTKIAFVKGRLNISSNNTIAANRDFKIWYG